MGIFDFFRSGPPKMPKELVDSITNDFKKETAAMAVGGLSGYGVFSLGGDDPAKCGTVACIMNGPKHSALHDVIMLRGAARLFKNAKDEVLKLENGEEIIEKILAGKEVSIGNCTIPAEDDNRAAGNVRESRESGTARTLKPKAKSARKYDA